MPSLHPSSRPRRTRLTALAGIALIVAACGGSSTAPSSTSSVQPTISASAPASASPSASVTASPSPSSSTAWVAALAALADPTASLKSAISGTVKLGADATVDGSYEQAGPDLHLVLHLHVNGKTVDTEQTVSKDQTYLKSGPLWRHVVLASGAKRPAALAVVLKKVTGATSLGADTVGSKAVERFSLQGVGVGEVTAAMGLTDPNFDVSDATMALLATPDGVPAALDLAFTEPGRTASTWDIRVVFSPVLGTASIVPPEEVWIVKDPGHGYKIWYPETWQVDVDPKEPAFADFFIGPKETGSVTCEPATTQTLAAWVKDGRTYYAKLWGAKFDQETKLTLLGTDAVISVWSDVKVDKSRKQVTVVSLVTKKHACDFLWYRDPGADNASDVRFGEFIGTFTED